MVLKILHRHIQFESSSPSEKPFEGHPGLEPCQRGSKAEMDAPSKSDMAAWGCAIHVERIGVLEGTAVTIGGWPQQHHSGIGWKIDAG